MKQLLLDTHVLLWALGEPEKLSRRAKKAIESAEDDLLVSAASAWEIATKFRLGKLPMAAELVRTYAASLAQLRASEIPITSAHALRAGGMAGDHRDPFDRVIAAQALSEKLTLVTADPIFSQLGVAVTW